MNIYTAKEPKELNAISKLILDEAGTHRLFAFFGEMGAGKTTLIKELCKSLGVKDTGSSPTFSLVNEYLSYDGKPVYHFDFYRINTLEEAYDMGYEMYFYSGNYCFIEWPEKIEELLPQETVVVRIEIQNAAVRQITLQLPA